MKSFTATIFTANYYPEDTAIGLYTTQFAKHLVSKGFQVNIITGFPYYPQWKISETYKDKSKFYIEQIDGCTIFRYKQFVPEKITFLGRIRLMLSLFYGNLVNSRKIQSSDIVFCIVPFTFSIFPAFLLARRLKSKLWVHIQDFEFDLALETGILKNNILTKPLKKIIFSLESFLLNRADTISSISNNMLSKISEKSNAKDIVYFPNWVSAGNINPSHHNQHSYIDPSKFTLLYSGNVGEKQDWEFFERFCSMVTDPDIEIVIVGDGSYLETLKSKVQHYSFIKFLPLVNYDELSDLLCSANVHFLFQKTDVVDTVMPSKLLGMMASARPSLITGNQNSEVAAILKKSDGGMFFYNNDAEFIYNQLITLKNNSDLATKTGINARNFVLETFSENTILTKITSEINERISQK
ncbi:hypothetical protein FEDK69T_06100 [Flavobacterium enshiense DK69]|uniref:Glycosyl transferase family 1 n=1 Tax=Flavobacterium enshiense DK69 TaxID=1107311 RepID=V6SBZ3_9FLAO|nr:WcaI family glycosyltransferase [Flavobacterium enshiense]ESU24173.1 hypothetical protein FEDK69T_06100 [Flavobacterium enshiense DK69]KGO95450.1 hypothetical protein Q767_11650 [Flavobacterium enshiense DK69]